MLIKIDGHQKEEIRNSFIQQDKINEVRLETKKRGTHETRDGSC